MADFLELETVSELEAYERGEKELPRSKIEDLVDFFFLRKEFFESSSVSPFRTLYIYDKAIGVLLDQNFRVLFLCKPKPRDGLYTFPVLWKIERNYVRVVSTNLSSFHEDGRGRFNVEHLILLMLERGIPDTETTCIATSNQNWKLLEESAFYFSKMGDLGSIDVECQEIFQHWYQDKASQDKESAPVHPTNLSILWVDDHPDENIPLRNVLEQHSLNITIARSTAEAMVLLNTQKFNCIITDMGREEFWQYNALAGLDLVKKVREQNTWIPIIIFTTVHFARWVLLKDGIGTLG